MPIDANGIIVGRKSRVMMVFDPPHVPGLGAGGDVDDHRRQPQNLLEQQLHQMGLAAAGGPMSRKLFWQHVLALGPVEVDALDALDVAVGHQRDRPPRLVLPAITCLLQLLEDLLRRNDGQLQDELDEVLEPGFPVLLEVLHRLGFARHVVGPSSSLY